MLVQLTMTRRYSTNTRKAALTDTWHIIHLPCATQYFKVILGTSAAYPQQSLRYNSWAHPTSVTTLKNCLQYKSSGWGRQLHCLIFKSDTGRVWWAEQDILRSIVPVSHRRQFRHTHWVHPDGHAFRYAMPQTHLCHHTLCVLQMQEFSMLLISSARWDFDSYFHWSPSFPMCLINFPWDSIKYFG